MPWCDTFHLVYVAPTPPVSVTLARAPNGGAGAFHTLAIMRGYVDRFKKDPDLINAAISIIWLAPEKDDRAEVDALFRYVRDSIRYVRDVFAVETLADPLTTMRRGVGDCDDKTTLFCALAESVGYPTRFVMSAYFGARDFEHVYCQVLLDSGWIDADATQSEPLGFSPAAPTRRYIERI